MIYNVRMLAHHDVNHIRPVYVPDNQIDKVGGLLDAIFKYGQNDFVCGPDADKIRSTTCSVSVGDVVELPRGNYMVTSMDFKLLTSSEYDRYKEMDGDARWMYCRS